MSPSYDEPPSDWPGMETAGVTRLTDDIYYGWLEHETTLIFWHRCTALANVQEERRVHGPWVAAGTSQHTLASRDPLHLEPLLLRSCCSLHGWVRNGQWINA